MTPKSPFNSKTLIFNALALALIIARQHGYADSAQPHDRLDCRSPDANHEHRASVYHQAAPGVRSAAAAHAVETLSLSP